MSLLEEASLGTGSSLLEDAIIGTVKTPEDNISEKAETKELRKDVGATVQQAKSTHDQILENMRAIGTNPLHPEVQALRDEFWSKYTPTSLRSLLLEGQNARVARVLVVTTTCMFTLPVGIMYLTQSMLSHLDDDTRWMVAAVVAVVTVNIILGIFSVVAYVDEKRNWEDKLKFDASEKARREALTEAKKNK